MLFSCSDSVGEKGYLSRMKGYLHRLRICLYYTDYKVRIIIMDILIDVYKLTDIRTIGPMNGK